MNKKAAEYTFELGLKKSDQIKLKDLPRDTTVRIDKLLEAAKNEPGQTLQTLQNLSLNHFDPSDKDTNNGLFASNKKLFRISNNLGADTEVVENLRIVDLLKPALAIRA